MRILIVPFIEKPKADAAYHLTKNLISAFCYSRNAIAVSASEQCAFRHIALYPDTPRGRSIPGNRHTKRSYEQWLLKSGAGSEKYLSKDMDNLLEIMDHFKPDVVLTIDRIAAIAAAREKNIPCYVFTSSAVYRNVDVDECMEHFNRFLQKQGMKPVFTLKDLFDTCRRQFIFGPGGIQPLPAEIKADRLGMQCIQPLCLNKEPRILIDLMHTQIPGRILRSRILKAFENHDREVRVRYPGCRMENVGNVRFFPALREDLLSASSLMIHDGNSWIMDACIARGIPQIILSDSSYIRSWNAQCLERAGAGIRLAEKEFSSAALADAVARILQNPSYTEQSCQLMQESHALGDLSKLYDILKQDLTSA